MPASRGVMLEVHSGQYATDPNKHCSPLPTTDNVSLPCGGAGLVRARMSAAAPAFQPRLRAWLVTDTVCPNGHSKPHGPGLRDVTVEWP